MSNIKPDVKDTVKGFTKEYVGEVVRESTKKLLKRLTKDKRAELAAKLKDATAEELKHYLNSNPDLKAALDKTISSVKEASLQDIQAAYEENFSKVFAQPASPVPAKGVITIKVHTLIACMAFVAILSIAAALYVHPWPVPTPTVTPTILPDETPEPATPTPDRPDVDTPTPKPPEPPPVTITPLPVEPGKSDAQVGPEDKPDKPPAEPPEAPSPDDGIDGWSKNNSRTFTWDPPESQAGIKGYNYKVDDDPVKTTGSPSATVSSPSDGTHTFYVNAVDSLGHTGPWGSHDFKVDTTAPEGKMYINNGDDTTDSPDVTLTIRYEDAGSGVKNVRFSNDNNSTGGWEPLPAGDEKAWKLSGNTVFNAPGMRHGQVKTVYYQFMDELDHTSPVYSAQITLMPARPDPPAPAVVNASPRGNAVSLMPTIKVIFSVSMDKSSVESAFSTTPEIDGKFGWADATTMTFTPLKGLPESASYTITIGTGAKSADNKELGSPYTWGFRTTIG